MTTRQKSRTGSYRRSIDGVIISLVDLCTGQTRATHLGGVQIQHGASRSANRYTETTGVRRLLAQLASEIDKWDGDWRITSISSPDSILADLRGERKGPPEPGLLQSIGRSDLWIGNGRD